MIADVDFIIAYVDLSIFSARLKRSDVSFLKCFILWKVYVMNLEFLVSHTIETLIVNTVNFILQNDPTWMFIVLHI